MKKKMISLHLTNGIYTDPKPETLFAPIVFRYCTNKNIKKEPNYYEVERFNPNAHILLQIFFLLNMIYIYLMMFYKKVY